MFFNTYGLKSYNELKQKEALCIYKEHHYMLFRIEPDSYLVPRLSNPPQLRYPSVGS